MLVYALDRNFANNDWFFARCREVQFSPDGYIDLWAREHGKSTVITITKTIQDILCNPEITVGIFSHTRSIAKTFLRAIKREFESNNKLKEWFPDIFYTDPQKEAPKWSEDDGIIVKRRSNPPESTVEACGLVEGMPTGRHFNLRVYDDVVTLSGTSSPEQIFKTTEAMDMSDNLGQIGGKVRIIGTRYKLGDTYEDYIKRGIYKPRIHSATDNGRVDGNPVFFTPQEWERRLNTQSPAIIASQMLQNPLADESVIFMADWFNLWPAYFNDKDGNEMIKPLPAFDAVYMSLDGAFSEKTSADYSCLLTLGLFKATEGSAKYSIFLLDCLMERLSYPDLRDKIISAYDNKYGANDCAVTAIIIEDKSSGSALIPELRRGGVPVLPYNPGSLDKIGRAHLVSHLVRDGYVWLPESRKRKGYPINWLSEWHEQIQYFPNVKNDDGVDSFTQALSVLQKMGFLRGRAVPPKEMSYWHKLSKGTYS